MERKRLEGSRAVVLAETLYEDLELWYPALRLREEGAEVRIAAPKKGQYRGKHGYPVDADVAAADLRVADFEAVVIPGGYAPDHLRRHREVLDFVRGMFQQGRVVAAICHAAWVPISAGILRGRRLTCFHAIRDDVVNAGAEYLDREVVRDGNLISSRQPSDLPAFCLAIIEAMAERRRT